MTVALILLVALLTVGTALYLLDRHLPHGNEAAARPAVAPEEPTDGECCGQHLVCERLTPEPGEKPEYYDDYELDAFRGRAPESYTEEETEAFRDVLLTMAESDVAGWARSLQLRGVEPPLDVRQEMIMLLAEQRMAAKA